MSSELKYLSPVSEQPRTPSRADRPRASALALVIVGLLGLVGLVYLLWPKPAPIERIPPSDEGSAWQIEARRAVLSGPTMGTSFTVVLAGSEFDRDDLARVQAQIDAELRAVNAEMSTYREDSELSRFNRSGAHEPFAASPQLLEVVALAKRVGEQSGGAFDVTVGPLVDAWGFGPGDPTQRVELDDAEIAALRELVGDDKLLVDRTRGSLSKAVAGLRVDLSAIAKGHGNDRVAAVLDAASYDRYMIEIGGEVRVRGSNPSGEPWKVGIERPTADAAGSRAVQTILRVRDVSVATSGGYRNYWERDGVRYSHTLDPRTGRPIDHALASVTVIHEESAAHADAWATALNVLGPDEGPALAERLGLAAYFLVRTREGFETRSTSAFAEQYGR
jgi:FAD:protein FMN transferase